MGVLLEGVEVLAASPGFFCARGCSVRGVFCAGDCASSGVKAGVNGEEEVVAVGEGFGRVLRSTKTVARF